jgi:sterol desaturase/sphingolipid hydroxylase (fatty acid hydroxylase superfamily)
MLTEPPRSGCSATLPLSARLNLPVLAVGENTTTPAVVLTAYACLDALPHANVRWTYGRAGRIFISPAYHRIHHSATGRPAGG